MVRCAANFFCLFFLWCFLSTETIRLIRNTETGGIGYLWLARPSTPTCKDEETVSHCQTTTLTPSPPEPVQFPGWKMQGRACKEYIFQSYNIYFQCFAFSWLSFHMPVQKTKQKGLWVWNFALLRVVFKVTSGGDPPVRSNLCTSLIAVSPAVQSTHKKDMSKKQLLRNSSIVRQTIWL